MKTRGFYGLLFGLILALVTASNSVADTYVSGSITSDTTWTPSGSPYIVTGSVLVNSTVTLTIEPGVTVRFNSGKALQIDGTLIARGTSKQDITFTSNQPIPAAGDWGYILFSNSSTDATYDVNGNYTGGSILEYVTVEYAGGASVSDNGAVRMNDAHPFINYCTIRNNGTYSNGASGIYASNLTSTLKITNSTISNNTAAFFGGGISTSGGTITVSDNTISNNTASEGGGISASGGTITISDNIISNNTASEGGGIFVYNSTAIFIFNNIISNNSVSSTYYGGGGIYIDGTATISNNIINNNVAISLYGGGGGIFVGYGSTTTISNNIISNNTLSMDNTYWPGGGGGIYINGAATISNNIISNNIASGACGEGGAIYVPSYHWINFIYEYYGIATISNNFLINNIATNSAAVYYAGGDDKDFKYNTITGNRATKSDPAYAYSVYVSSHPFFNYNNLFSNKGNNTPFFYEFWNNNAQSSANMDAENNWWGTATESEIQAKIYDWFDNSTKGIVDYSPFATTIRSDAPISPPTGLTATTGTDSITLNWSANPESDTSGYKVYWDTDSGHPYANSVDVGNVASYTITDLAAGTYHVTVTAYETSYNPANDDPNTIVNENQTNGNESWYAEEKEVNVSGAQTWFEEDDPTITYTGTWNTYTCASCSGEALKYSNQTGAKADFTFNGTGIKWIVTKAPMLGKAKVYLDGAYLGMVDLYSPTPQYQVPLPPIFYPVSPGNHTVTIEVSGQKNPSATGYYIDIDAFEIVP